jgi:hypothetical protein
LLLTLNSTTLELISGQLYVNVGGELKVLATVGNINDGDWHSLKLDRTWRGGKIELDGVVTEWRMEIDEDSHSSWGDEGLIGYASGGGDNHWGSNVWSAGLGKGFVGCVAGLDDIESLIGRGELTFLWICG